jgi:hypothetical protein
LDKGVEYRPVPGFPDYRVGDDGSVWSAPPWRRLKPNPWTDSVVLCARGARKVFHVPRLVLRLFKGEPPRPDAPVVYLDFDSRNWRAPNLKWGGSPLTSGLPPIRRIMHLGWEANRGERHHKAKLTRKQVRDMRRRREAGESVEAVAAAHGVSESTVSAATFTRATWWTSQRREVARSGWA